MSSNFILLIGSVLVVVSTVLWYFNFIEEPSAALSGALLSAFAYYYTFKNEKKSKESEGNKGKKKQEHKVKENNVTGDKIIDSYQSQNLITTSSKVKQKHSGSGDNVGGNKIVNK